VECAPDEFELAMCDYSPASYYAFSCPSCGLRVQKHADARISELLIAEGVPAFNWELPAEAIEPHEGATLTIDDVLDMTLALQQPDWFEQFASSVAS
jgi:hypothetical protein